MYHMICDFSYTQWTHRYTCGVYQLKPDAINSFIMVNLNKNDMPTSICVINKHLQDVSQAPDNYNLPLLHSECML